MKKQLMLSGQCPPLSQLSYPVLVSRKLDGIRAFKLETGLVSRTLKPIPNEFIQKWGLLLPSGFDGEITLRDETAEFRLVDSAVMSAEGEPDFVFRVFDLIEDLEQPSIHFQTRYDTLLQAIAEMRHVFPEDWMDRLQVVEHHLCFNAEEVDLLHEHHLSIGCEGTMIRSLDGPYKFGRSTEREGYLLKLKNFADEEGDVIGIIEEMQNNNEATTNAQGLTERSTHKAGKAPKGRLGAFVLRLSDGTTFECGSGFTAEQRKKLWESGIEIATASQEHLAWTVQEHPGALPVPVGTYLPVTFKHQPPPGGRQRGQKPRIPVFKAFRKEE